MDDMSASGYKSERSIKQDACPDVEPGAATTDIQPLHDGDAALGFLRRQYVSNGEVDSISERRLLHKIDFYIVPLMLCVYTLQYLDKTLINYAAVMGLYTDANITAGQFSTLALIFYVTYLFFEFPHGWAMQRLPTAKYLGVMVSLWGVIVAVTSAANNYSSLVTLRVLLGCFESTVAPALILLSSMWYKRSEQPLRIGFWYIGTGLGTIFGSLISFGFQHYRSATFTSWQIIFLVVGIVTVAVGIAVFMLMPDNPMKSRLTQAEKILAIDRVRENKTGIENKHFKAYQALECLRDPQTWLMSVICISASIPNGAVSSYQATIIKGFGYTSEQTALLQIPSGVIAVTATLAGSYVAGRYNARGLATVALNLIGGVLGGGLLAFMPNTNKGAVLAGNYLTQFIGASLPLQYSWVAANFSGHTKKVTMNAILLCSFCIGNILGPLSFQGKDAPDYVPAKITILAVCAISCMFTVVLMAYYIWMNKRKESACEGKVMEIDEELSDKTDKEQLWFRYKL